MRRSTLHNARTLLNGLTKGALTTALYTGLCFGAGAALLPGCSSNAPRRAGDDLGLNDEEKLGLFLENSLRYLDIGDIDRAQDQARKGLEIDPKNERLLLMFADCALVRGSAQDIQVALDAYQRVGNQADFRVQRGLGTATERLGSFYQEAAEGILSGNRATDADDPVRRAKELEETARAYWEDARTHFEESLAARSGEPAAINGLVRTTALLGETQVSIQHARDLIDAISASQRKVDRELDDADITARDEARLFQSRASNTEFEVKARLHIATLLRSEGDPEGSIDELDAIIALDPYMAEAHSLKAQLLYETKDFVKARASVTRFLEMKAPTTTVNDPVIKQAFELRERCDKEILGSSRG